MTQESVLYASCYRIDTVDKIAHITNIQVLFEYLHNFSVFEKLKTNFMVQKITPIGG